MNDKLRKIICCLIILLTSNILLFYSNETAQADVSEFRQLYSTNLGVRIESIDWNPNGTQYAVGFGNGFINIYNSSTYQLEFAINATWYPTWICPKWNPNGSLIAGGGCDNRVYIFDAVTGERLKYFDIGHGCAQSIAWSPNGKFLANGNNWNNLTQIWDVETGKKVTEFSPDNSPTYYVSWSPDGTKLVTGSRSVDVWYTSNWTKMTSFKGDLVGLCAWSPNGKLLAIFFDNYNISFYNTSDWSLYRNILSDFDMRFIAWSPDSTKIVCGSYLVNGTEAKIWDVAKGTAVMTIPGEGDVVAHVAWSPDGKFIAIGVDDLKSYEGKFEIWGELSSVIRLVSFSCNRAELEIGENLSCTATIRNYGSLDGTNQSLRFYMDNDSLSERLINIPKGTSVDQTLELKISKDTKPGQHVLKAKLNSDEKKFPVMVLGKPDIYIKDITTDRKVVTVGQTVSITTTLGNNGTADSPDTVCTLFHGSDVLNSTHLMVKQNSTQSYLFKLDTKDLKTGDYTIKAVTGDRSKEITITIKQKVGTNVIPIDFYLSIILLIIVMTIIVTLYSRGRRSK
jgi:WD40 repeat protein